MPTTSGTPARPALQGRVVYVDRDNDKVADAGERQATTNAAGNYKISNLPAGKNWVRQVLPAGWEQTSPTGGGAIQATVTANQNLTGRNFGARRTPPPPAPPTRAIS